MSIEDKALEVIDLMDVKEDDYEYIDVNLTEIEKKRIKNNVKKKVFNKSTGKKKTMIAAGVLTAVVLSGITIYRPAFAENNPVFDTIYDSLGYYKDYKDYTRYVGESKSSNGYTFTIEKLVGTPNKIIMAIKIHSEKPFKKIEEVKSMFMPSFWMNDIMWDGGATGCTLLDKNNLMMVIEQDSISGFPKRGNIKMNIHSTVDDETKVDFNIKADFSSSYKKTITRRLKGKTEDGNIKIEKLKSSIIGSLLFVDNYHVDKEKFLLKLDDKIYAPQDVNSREGKGNLYFPSATYEKVKLAKKISVIPVKNGAKYTYEEEEKISKKISKDLKDTNRYKNIKYNKYVTFSDGTKGEFYKLERNNNKVKMYFRSDKYAKQFATCVKLHEYLGTEDGYNHTIKQHFPEIYKDPNDKNGYIMEVNNVSADRELEISFYIQDLIPERQIIGEEIKVGEF